MKLIVNPHTIISLFIQNPAFITGLYNQYILQQNSTQQQLNASSGGPIDENNVLKSDAELHSNQPSTSPMENNLMLQINADKQTSTPSTTNNEILQQLYNYSQMSGELIK